jgi:single-strand DNA-binding protein
MNDLNHCILEGNAVKDPVLRSTHKGTPVCNFAVACNRFFKGPGDPIREVSFFEIEAWGDLGKSCANMGRRGRGVRITGYLKQERWETADGDNRSKIILVAERVDWKPEKKGDTKNEDKGA